MNTILASCALQQWETTFDLWSQGPSQTESTKAENAERGIREAIQSSHKLQNRNIQVFTQGSYRNRVNVRASSDVDIGILCRDVFFDEYPNDNIKQAVKARHSFEPATYTYQQFKNEIHEALVNHFGVGAVTRGNKSFDIQANSYRVEADVAAFFEYRYYYSEGNYHSGVELIPDNYTPLRIRNWPEQHYKNGVSKNTQTQRKYKRNIRILKCLRNQMHDKNIASAKNICGFLIEGLMWNVPDVEYMLYERHTDRIKAALVYLYNQTKNDSSCSEWSEVSELKYLFKSSQKWNREEVNDFISDAWNYLGF